MSNTVETNLMITAGILRKIDAADPNAKRAILKRHEENWRIKEEKKNTLKAIFSSKAFWSGFKDGFTAPFNLLANMLQPKSAKRTEPEILDRADSFDGYARELCRAIHEHLNENAEILEKIHLNNKERDLVGLPHRVRVQWADDTPSHGMPSPSV